MKKLNLEKRIEDLKAGDTKSREKEKLKIALADFWKGKPGDEPIHGFFNLLRTKYDLEYSQNPDLLFCSVFTEHQNHQHLRYDCMKCLISLEPPKKAHNLWDYSISVLPTDDKNLQFYFFVMAEHFQKWLYNKSNYCDKLKAHPKERFCNFVQRFRGTPVRIQFCQQLMEFKTVDCPGLILNNMPSPDNPKLSRNLNKLQFLKHYRFTICFENTSQPHFMAEKLPLALMAGSIPIYWGNTRIGEYFNPKAMINVHDYNNFDDVIKRIIEIEGNPALYQEYIKQPPVLPDSKLFEMTSKVILERIEQIVERIKLGSPPPFSKTSEYEYAAKKLVSHII